MQDPSFSELDRIVARVAWERGAFSLDVDLDVPARGITAIFGPSGAGKTTLLRVIAGLQRARGTVRVGTETWQNDESGVFVATHRRAIGFVFQEPALFSHLTVEGNLGYARRRRGDALSPAQGQAILEMLDVGKLLARRPRNLSGGEQQRVAMARALFASPRLLLMDEPLSSLDAARKAEVLPYLQRLRDESKVPILYVSHALEEVSRLADHMAVLEGGRLLATGSARAVLGRMFGLGGSAQPE